MQLNKTQKVSLVATTTLVGYWGLWWLLLGFLDASFLEAVVAVFGVIGGIVLTLFTLVTSWVELELTDYCVQKLVDFQAWLDK